MADDEDGPKTVNSEEASEHETVPDKGNAMPDVEDWATIVARTSLRSGRAVEQETSQEYPPSSTQSFRESHGLVRCSIRESVNESQRKRKGKEKAHKVPTVTKTQNKNVVVANTRLPADSLDIEGSRSQLLGPVNSG